MVARLLIRCSVRRRAMPSLKLLDISGADPDAYESGEAFAARVAAENPYNVVTPAAASEFALVGQFVSLLLCVGHVKSTKPGDEAFVKAFSSSPKWLAIRK